MDNQIYWAGLAGGLVIIGGLAYYAGTLLFKLRHQERQQENRRMERITTILFSVHTIAKATLQQQCELSEASIRLCHLMDALPLKSPLDFSLKFPALYQLFDKIKHMPTHDARKELTARERLKQDIQRGEFEAELESKILEELSLVSTLKVS